MQQREHHVFGPVPSRRLGRSLGIDLVPHKTCSYDCIYCQLGATTNRTLERRPYVSIGTVLREIEARLAATPAPNYITLSGSGEPTLQTGLSALLRGIKRLTPVPVAVLTNGSLLWREDVQTELQQADLVIPSLDAGDEAMFRRVNRPVPELRFERVIEGLIAFHRNFPGQIWLEVFLLAGMTTADEQIAKIGTLAAVIAPDRIQLNTVVRPPSEAFARAASTGELSRAVRQLGRRAEIIAGGEARSAEGSAPPHSEQIIALLQRRPCTLDDVATGLGLHRLEVAKLMDELLRGKAIVARQHDRRIYYRLGGRATLETSSRVRGEEPA